METGVRRISEEERNSFWNRFIDGGGDFLGTLGSFLGDFWIPLLVLLIGAFLLFWALKKMQLHQQQVAKLWHFTLFFLTKRQMTIPLIWTLAKRDGFLDEAVLKELFHLREQAREKSLKKSPTERLALEKRVSEILFTYFTALEGSGKIVLGSKFEHIVKDLEFIDRKLVELQTVYNRESLAWNQKWIHRGGVISRGLFRFRTFEPFSR